MALRETIQQHFVNARKARDSVCANLLGVVLAEITTLEKKPSQIGKPITDEDLIQVMRKLVISNEEVLKVVPGDAKAKQEIEILDLFLPKLMDNVELHALVTKLVDERGMTNIGDIMKTLKAEHAGQFDGKAASTITKAVLGARKT